MYTDYGNRPPLIHAQLPRGNSLSLGKLGRGSFCHETRGRPESERHDAGIALQNVRAPSPVPNLGSLSDRSEGKVVHAATLGGDAGVEVKGVNQVKCYVIENSY